MFQEADIKPVEHVEKVKKPRKKRAPMSEEQKEVLRERLKKAREAKKAKKEGKVVAPPVPKVAPKVELKVAPKVTPKVPKVEKPIVEKNVQADELDAMRKELQLLKTRNKQHEKELLRASLEKEKLKKQGLEYLKKNPAKPMEQMETIKEHEIQKPKVTTPEIIPKKPERYSTYKKSIWSKFE